MALPVIQSLTYETTLPLSGTVVQYRPYTVADEKLIIQGANALKDKDVNFYARNVKKVIKSCINGDPDNIIEKLSFVDIEWLLIQIRAKSVGEIIEAKFPDPETKRPTNASINLEEFVLIQDEKHSKKIEITDTIGIMMRDIGFEEKLRLIAEIEEKGAGVMYDIIVDCVDCLYDDETIYRVGENMTKKELAQFIDNTSGISKNLQEYIATMPRLKGEIVLDNGKTIDISGSEIAFLLL